MAKFDRPKLLEDKAALGRLADINASAQLRGYFSYSAVTEAIRHEVLTGQLGAGVAALEAVWSLHDHLEKTLIEINDWNLTASKSDHVVIPSWIFYALATSWSKYVDGPIGTELGAAFEIGRRQDGRRAQGGRKNTRDAIERMRRDYLLALAVLNQFVDDTLQKKASSFEEAYKAVSELTGLDYAMVKRAWKERQVFIKALITRLELPIEFPTDRP